MALTFVRLQTQREGEAIEGRRYRVCPECLGAVPPFAAIVDPKTGLNDPEGVAVGASGRVPSLFDSIWNVCVCHARRFSFRSSETLKGTTNVLRDELGPRSL